MVGPDDARKCANHANPDGFFHEGEAFLPGSKAIKLVRNAPLSLPSAGIGNTCLYTPSARRNSVVVQ
jgi:hypothetical protein